MVEPRGIEDVEPELAKAVGLVALADISLIEAAEETGVMRWKLEDALERAALAEPLGVELDGDVAAEIDALLDEYSPS